MRLIRRRDEVVEGTPAELAELAGAPTDVAVARLVEMLAAVAARQVPSDGWPDRADAETLGLVTLGLAVPPPVAGLPMQVTSAGASVLDRRQRGITR